MNITYEDNKYRITHGALSMVENALGNPNLVQVAVASSCSILVAPSSAYGISYKQNGEYAAWNLTGINTRLNRPDKHYIYARLNRAESSGMVIFSVKRYRTDGKVFQEGEEMTLPTEDDPMLDGRYYYILIGTITETDGNPTPVKLRFITLDGGYLSTPQGNSLSEMFRLIAGRLIQPLKHMASHIVEGSLSVIGSKPGEGKILLNEKEFSDIARDDDEDKPADDVTLPTTAYLFGKFTQDLCGKFLRKDIDDTTLYKLFIGEFVDSMVAGKGTGIFPDGRIQTDRMEVRGSLSVMDLIINEIHAMAGDFAFSDCGKIERVEAQVSANTYKLWMAKETATDLTTLQVNDVLYSIINNLRIGGTDYYTSWFRVLSKSISENSITVVLYPHTEVPGGKNYPPQAKYNVTRRGNAVLPDPGKINERAQSWMISSREGRIMFLQNVYKPVLEDYNYSLVIGKLPKIDVIDRLALTNDIGIYTQTIVCEKLYRKDWNGDVVSNKVDRGAWDKKIAASNKPYRFIRNTKEYPDGLQYTELEQHTVYYYGCKWGCINDCTQLEPIWNSPDWVLLEGDSNYHLEFQSSKGWQFHAHNVDTIIMANVSYANRNITDKLMLLEGIQTEWLRSTGQEAADNTWKPKFVDGKPNVIHLNRDDMGMGWGYEYRKITFIFRVFIPIGEEKYEKIENKINIKV